MMFVYPVITVLRTSPEVFWGVYLGYIFWDLSKIYIKVKSERIALRRAKELCGIKDERVLEFQKRTGTKF